MPFLLSIDQLHWRLLVKLLNERNDLHDTFITYA